MRDVLVPVVILLAPTAFLLGGAVLAFCVLWLADFVAGGLP